MARIRGLDGIRAYAALIVVTTHLHIFIDWYYDQSPLYGLVWGANGVNIFFVLSGFLITNLLYKEYKEFGTINIKMFIIRRSLRIFPAFYLFIMSVIIISLFFETFTSQIQILYSSLYAFNFIPRAENNIILAHTWSLAVEEHFYIIWPTVLLLLLKFKSRPETVMFVIIAIIYSLQGFEQYLYAETDLNNIYRVRRWTNSAATYLLSGCFGGLFIHTNWWNKYSSNQILSWLLSILFFIGFFVDFWFEGELLHSENIRVIGVISGILWVYINQKSNIVKMLELPPIRYLGQVSYGIYLWQGFFLATGPGRAGGQEWPLDPTTGLILLCMTVPLSYHLFELKFLKLKDRFRPQIDEEE